MSVSDRTGLKTGQAAPIFSPLQGTDGKTHGLADYKGASALVIFFSCNHCPYVQAYEDRIIGLQEEFRDRGVRFVAINSNDADRYPEDSFEEMVKRSRDRKFNFDYLHDESQAVAKAYGATHTPHLFVFDRDQKLAYTGRIDDNWQDPSRVNEMYLRDALSALVSGRAPTVAETFAIGCTIKWR